MWFSFETHKLLGRSSRPFRPRQRRTDEHVILRQKTRLLERHRHSRTILSRHAVRETHTTEMARRVCGKKQHLILSASLLYHVVQDLIELAQNRLHCVDRPFRGVELRGKRLVLIKEGPQKLDTQ